MKNLFGLMMAAVTTVALQSCGEQKTELTLLVKTQAGVVEGFEADGVKKFLGVPFATPPVGELRWQAPKPLQAWDGVR